MSGSHHPGLIGAMPSPTPPATRREAPWRCRLGETVADRAVEIMGELKLLQILEQFFDRAIYFAAVGYEEQMEHLRLQEREVVAG
jgi:hypothetical protein